MKQIELADAILAALSVADAILAALNEQPNFENKLSRLFIMGGHDSCGKTFTYNYLIAETRSRHSITTKAAWTGIAATLLNKVCTLHGLFKVPEPILENSTSCNSKFCTWPISEAS